MNLVDRPVTFSWDPVPGSIRYKVEVGTSPGTADVFSATTSTLSITTAFTSPGQVYPRVVAYGRAGSRASGSGVSLILLSFQDYIEALFLGTGPLAQTPQSGCPAGTGRMASWPAGTEVAVTLAASLTAEQQRRAAVVAGQAAEATGLVVGATTRLSSERHPPQGPAEIVVHQADQTLPFPCSAGAVGCTVPQFLGLGIFSSASIVMRGNASILGHETGHALYGFCHVTAAAGSVSVMGSFDDAGVGLSETDVAATRAVYMAGLRGGSMRGDFIAAGLIRP